MLTIIFAIILVGSWIWIGWEIYHAPTMKEEEDIDDPTTTIWHDDDHHPDSKF